MNNVPKSQILAGGSSYDLDAQAYFTAASITDSAEKNRINTFILRLKGGVGSGTPNESNLWQYRVQMILSNSVSLASSMVNLFNPGVYDAIAINSPSHSAAGIDFDGSTQYLRLGVIPSVDFTDTTKITVFSYLTNNVGTNSKYIMGADQGTTQRFLYNPRSGAAADQFIVRMYNSTGGAIGFSPATNSSSLAIFTKEANNNARGYRRTTQIGVTDTSANGGTLPSIELYGMANNSSSTPLNHSDNVLQALGSFTQGFTANMIADFDFAMQELQTGYAREVA